MVDIKKQCISPNVVHIVSTLRLYVFRLILLIITAITGHTVAETTTDTGDN